MILGKPIFLYDNLLKSYAPAATSEASGFPASNLYDDDLNSLWKATGSGDQTISTDAGAGNTVTADSLFIGNHNLFTAGAGLIMQGSDDNFAADKTTVLAHRPPSDELLGAMARIIVNEGFEVWGAGTSVAPSGWTFAGTGGSVARNSTTVKEVLYSASITSGAGDFAVMSSSIVGDHTYYQSKTVSLGCWVRCSTANAARVYIYDGTTTYLSGYHSGVDGWEWLTVTCNVPASITALKFGLRVEAGSVTAHFDGARARVWPSVSPADTSDFSQPVSKRYWRVQLVSMTATPQIGELAFGARFTLPKWFADGFDDLEKDIERRVTIADGGQKETVTFFKRKRYPCRVRNIAVGSQAETDMMAWLTAVEDGTPFWFLYDLRGSYVPDFVALKDENPKAPISNMRRDFSFTLEQEL